MSRECWVDGGAMSPLIAHAPTAETFEVFMGSTFDDELNNLATHLQIKTYERSQFSQSLVSVRFLRPGSGRW
jgi:hypothetical protein